MEAIVVGYDGSEAAERALARAAELGEALTARLVVVSVSRERRLPVTAPVLESESVFVPSPVGGPMSAGQTMPLPDVDQERLPEPKELAQRQLEQARMSLARRRVEAEYVAEIGDAAERLRGGGRPRPARRT
jgi:nucleotide-binding universal stress UspA family protein